MTKFLLQAYLAVPIGQPFTTAYLILAGATQNNPASTTIPTTIHAIALPMFVLLRCLTPMFALVFLCIPCFEVSATDP